MEVISDFLSRGGDVLIMILILCGYLWGLVVDKYIFLRVDFSKKFEEDLQYWEDLKDKHSWKSERIKEAILSKVDKSLEHNMVIIKNLTALSSMFGLLGTVTGMIFVFDSIGYFGTSNARVVADGVSMATIPTMAGMATAISGLLAILFLKINIKKQRDIVLNRMDNV
ncbi:MAG: MotA/TolQ/ExbB proton channel family protein [Campylobacterales bacterium]|nr:MotA/TolQ/ExbB proton channel family protein [Campylobacterales bacterium]